MPYSVEPNLETVLLLSAAVPRPPGPNGGYVYGATGSVVSMPQFYGEMRCLRCRSTDMSDHCMMSSPRCPCPIIRSSNGCTDYLPRHINHEVQTGTFHYDSKCGVWHLSIGLRDIGLNSDSM